LQLPVPVSTQCEYQCEIAHYK